MAYGDQAFTIQDKDGTAITGVAISVFDIGTDDLATIYSSDAGAAQINPMTAATQFWAAAGYYDVRFWHPTYREQWVRGVQIVADTSNAAVTVTLTSSTITAEDIIKAALRKLRVFQAGGTLPPEDADDCLSVLNDMLDFWSSESLMIYALTHEAFALTASQSMFTIGPGGDFQTTRPESVDVASSFVRDASSNDTYLEPMTEREYRQIGLKSGSGLNSIPSRLWYDPQYPLGRLQFDCPLTSGYTLHLASLKPFDQFPDLTTEVSLPAGYRQALVYNLAVMLAPEYGKKVSPEVGAIAVQSKSHLEHKNARPIMADMSGVPGYTGGREFNVLTGR